MVIACTPFRVLTFQLLASDGTKYDPRFTGIQAVTTYCFTNPTVLLQCSNSRIKLRYFVTDDGL